MNDSDRRRSPDGFDDDAIFADIIAHLNDDEPGPEQPVMPVTDDAHTDERALDQKPGEAGQSVDTGPSVEQAPEGATTETTAPRRGEPQDVPAPQVWRAHEVDGDGDDEHFEPPKVNPLPVGDLQFWAILVGMIGGPLLLVYLVFFDRTMSGYWTLAAIGMSVGGFALLVSRLPGNPGDEDDGARL